MQQFTGRPRPEEWRGARGLEQLERLEWLEWLERLERGESLAVVAREVPMVDVRQGATEDRRCGTIDIEEGPERGCAGL